MSDPLRIEHDVVTRASPEALFTFVTDADRRPEWLTELRAVDARHPIEEGTRFTGRSSLFLHDFVGESEVVRLDHPHVIAEEVVIGARFTSTWHFEEAAGGTRVRHEIAIEFPGGPLGGVARRLLRWRLRRMQHKSLAALARYVEG